MVISKFLLFEKKKLNLTPAQALLLMLLRKKASENIVGRGEKASNQHCLPFPCFQPSPTQILICESHLSSGNIFNVNKS